MINQLDWNIELQDVSFTYSENTEIAEEGSYSNLIEKNGIFKELVEGQQL